MRSGAEANSPRYCAEHRRHPRFEKYFDVHWQAVFDDATEHGFAIRALPPISTVLVLVLVLMYVLPSLEAAGATVRVERERPVHDRRVDAILDLSLGKVRGTFAVNERRRSPYPNELSDLEPIRTSLTEVGTPMLVVPFVGEALGTALTTAGWSWADAAGNFDLRSDQLVMRQRSTAAPPRTRANRLPQGSGSLAIIRALITLPRDTDEDLGATAIAARVGVSQPRASQVLHRLLDLELVTRTPQRRWSPDREALLDRFLSEYRGPGGSERYLYSLDPPNEVAARAAQQTGDPTTLAVSADVGPDLLLGWRRPSVVVLYMRHPPDLDRLGLVDAQGRHDANVIIRIPDDTSVFPTHLLVAELGEVEVPSLIPRNRSGTCRTSEEPTARRPQEGCEHGFSTCPDTCRPRRDIGRGRPRLRGAIHDVANVLGSSMYRIIGGHMVTVLAARWQLGAELYRETADTGLDLPPIVVREQGVIDRLTERGYERVDGNRFARAIDDVPVAVRGTTTPRSAIVDILVPPHTTRARRNFRVSDELVTTEVPGLALAFQREPVTLQMELHRLTGARQADRHRRPVALPRDRQRSRHRSGGVRRG